MTIFERALVTGASSGIGRAIAQQLAATGTQVVLVARNEEALKETAASAPKQMEVMPADLSKTKDLENLAKYLETQPVDLLVNNAGIWSFGAFKDATFKDISKMMDVNMDALTKLCYAVIPKMIERQKGYILNVSSIAGGQPLPYENIYAATKAFVTTFSQGLYKELEPYGIGVTALLPGLVRTNLFEASGGQESVEKMPEFLWMDAKEVAEIALKATQNKKPICVPGAVNKVVASLVDVTPKPVLRTFATFAMKFRKNNIK